MREILEKRAALIAQYRAVLEAAKAENRGLNTEETAQTEKLYAEIQSLGQLIDADRQAADLERSLQDSAGRQTRAEPPGAGKQEKKVLTPAERRNTDEYADTFRRAFLGAKEQRALQADLDTKGGNLLMPGKMVSGILMNLDNLVKIRALATKFTTSGGEPSLGVVTMDSDLADDSWSPELPTLDDYEDDALTFGTREMRCNDFLKLVLISAKLLRSNTSTSVEGFVRDRIAVARARTEEKHFMTGTGFNQPLGLFTASANGIPTSRDQALSHTTGAAFDKADAAVLREAKFNLKEQYRNSPSLRWLFHDDFAKILIGTQDSNGQFLWQPSLQAGAPDRYDGVPIVTSAYAPNTYTSGLYAAILGDFSYYYILDDTDVPVQRFDERFAPKVGFAATFGVDGQPVLAEAFSRIKFA